MLPKTAFEITNGGLYRQFVKCGKQTCRCTRSRRHEAHYFISRCYGRQIKLYVPKSALEGIRELVAESRYLRWRSGQALSNADEEIRRLRRKLREIRDRGQMIEFVNEDSRARAF